MKTNENKKGISLIVLIITMLVMIILAAAIILNLDDTKIINKAEKAVADNNIAIAKEVRVAARAEWRVNEAKLREDYSSFRAYLISELEKAGIDYVTVSKDGAVNIIYTDKNNHKAIIPEDFTVSTVEGEQTIDNGLVIVDKDGNEFVWVPVPDISTFTLVEWGKGAVTVENTTSYNVNDAGEAAEYIAMKDSVEKYGGFYIARYEAGLPEGKTTYTVTITDKPVSKKGATVWNNIPWGESMTEIGTEGAVYRARQMYKGSKSVVSTLCYGVQWDAALQFIATNEEHKDYPTNSTRKGNYTENLLKTGSSNDYELNNIYDMAGNVCEWTMEVYSTAYPVIRGGHYYSDGASYPASDRTASNPAASSVYSGFRLTLYIK